MDESPWLQGQEEGLKERPPSRWQRKGSHGPISDAITGDKGTETYCRQWGCEEEQQKKVAVLLASHPWQ